MKKSLDVYVYGMLFFDAPASVSQDVSGDRDEAIRAVANMILRNISTGYTLYGADIEKIFRNDLRLSEYLLESLEEGEYVEIDLIKDGKNPKRIFISKYHVNFDDRQTKTVVSLEDVHE